MSQDGKFTITDEDAYIRLQYETSLLRLADGQRPVKDVNLTQSGKLIEISPPQVESEADPASFEGKISHFENEVTQQEVRLVPLENPAADNSTDVLPDPGLNAGPIEDKLSKKYYIGENNLDTGEVVYSPETGKLEVVHTVKDSRVAINCTFDVLKGRMEECRMPALKESVCHVVRLETCTNRQLRAYRSRMAKDCKTAYRVENA
jgi:hypothetical protein